MQRLPDECIYSIMRFDPFHRLRYDKVMVELQLYHWIRIMVEMLELEVIEEVDALLDVYDD